MKYLPMPCLERVPGYAPGSLPWQGSIILLYHTRLVGEEGLEPSIHCWRWFLKPVRMHSDILPYDP